MVSVDLDIELKVLTAASVADIVNGILEFLLYQRNQIPLMYKTYKYYVLQWMNEQQECDGGVQLLTQQKLRIERQREEAIQTKNDIDAMQLVIRKSLEASSVNCLRFIFGATTFTPREVYTIHIPKTIDRNHHLQNCEYYRIQESFLNKMLLSLLTSRELFDVFSNNLCPSNLFLEMEIDGELSNGLIENQTTSSNCRNELHLFPKEISKLPKNCKDVHLRLQHIEPTNVDICVMQCCMQHFEVFEDHQKNLSLHRDNNLKMENNHHYQISSSCQQYNSVVKRNWWEADLKVRGFKAKAIKGANLWSK